MISFTAETERQEEDNGYDTFSFLVPGRQTTLWRAFPGHDIPIARLVNDDDDGEVSPSPLALASVMLRRAMVVAVGQARQSAQWRPPQTGGAPY